MRSLQFGGNPIEISPNRVYNCAYLPIDSVDCFHEIMFLLLGGTGVGYSVQRHHVDKLPMISKPYEKRTRRFLIGDSIEGWADAIKTLMKSYLGNKRSSRIQTLFASWSGSPYRTRCSRSGFVSKSRHQYGDNCRAWNLCSSGESL